MGEERNVIYLENEKPTLKERAKTGFQKVRDWGSKHKESIIVFGPILISSAVELVKILKRDKTVKEDRRLKENYIYDRSAGHYYELKRKPTNKEWMMIDEGRKNENLGMVLNDMELLK